MDLGSVTFCGPPIDDQKILARLPVNLSALLQKTNGFIQFRGGLHVRGACHEPSWHSIRNAWEGEDAIHSLYADVRPDDVPFAEDCMGDQFLLRSDIVWRLSAETGELESMAVSLDEFLSLTKADPVEFLSMHPLLQFQQDGGNLAPGQLLAAFPPFFVKTEKEVLLRPIQTAERRRFLADVAQQIRDVPDGGKIVFKVTRRLN
jgi:hypothetical protein